MRIGQFIWLLVSFSFVQFNKRHVNSLEISSYTRFDAYISACNRSGVLQQMNEYDRLVEVLSARDLDFGVEDGWTKEDADRPRFKGCEPMKQGHKPVRCNVDSTEE